MRCSLVLMLALAAAAPAFAGPVTVAVASNFLRPAEQLAGLYRKDETMNHLHKTLYEKAARRYVAERSGA